MIAVRIPCQSYHIQVDYRGIPTWASDSATMTRPSSPGTGLQGMMVLLVGWFIEHIAFLCLNSTELYIVLCTKYHAKLTLHIVTLNADGLPSPRSPFPFDQSINGKIALWYAVDSLQ